MESKREGETGEIERNWALGVRERTVDLLDCMEGDVGKAII